ncbi:2OG-Fe(II) oxygenase [Rhodopila globiformis]|uniref:Prolyl 4-hydroxylase alpha subunit Fe(2+) 2OG dioxygenase domain-containing protein n=1 Tax=Rhodopila globiformis TaxID=1071 RepID=A0A2S6N3K0_RHOGL|nr:2OG-Fe(II) oxygenase [Rhodopila globiformis]PPQ29147.1 hypothetical protein CCS01_22405 [Rhodopila globiformis]
MSDSNAPLKMIDEAAVAAGVLRHDPYDYCYIDHALPERLKEEVLADAPTIPDRGSYALPDLVRGPKFDAVIQDLLSDRFRHLVEEKFDIDLSKRPPYIVMMGNTTGHYNEGYAHPDSKHKIITVLLGFSREWPHERGKLRILRSEDREDYAFEYPPEFGKMMMFRVCDHSWHGFLPQKAQRMSLQLCYVDSESYIRAEYVRHRVSAYVKSVPMLRRIVNLAPKRLPGAK